MTEPVRVKSNDGVLWITLDRPKANAIDVATSRTLYEAFDRLHRDESLRVGVVTGQGQRFFSAGWDLKAAAAGEAVDADHGTGGFAGLTEFFELDKPVIAAVNGMALGGGFELTLAADLVVAADHAEFALTEATLGMVADSGGVLRLPKRLPTVVAREMLLTGRRMSAAEAHHWGLVNDVVPIDRLAERSEELAHQVCGSAPLAVRAVQEVLCRTSELDVASGYSLMREGDLPTYQQVLSSADAEEGPQAFAAGRTPQWRGR